MSELSDSPFFKLREKEVSSVASDPVKIQVLYPYTATGNGFVSESLLRAEVAAAALSQAPAYVICFRVITVVFASALSDSDRAKLDAVVAAHTGGTTAVREAQKTAVDKINAKTAQLLGAGFVYSGKVFSLSITAQLNTVGAYSSRNEPGFVYPVVRFTMDDQDSVSLADVDAVEAFYNATVNAVRIVRDAGTALKAQINAATTVEAVGAVADNR